MRSRNIEKSLNRKYFGIYIASMVFIYGSFSYGGHSFYTVCLRNIIVNTPCSFKKQNSGSLDLHITLRISLRRLSLIKYSYNGNYDNETPNSFILMPQHIQSSGERAQI